MRGCTAGSNVAGTAVTLRTQTDAHFSGCTASASTRLSGGNYLCTLYVPGFWHACTACCWLVSCSPPKPHFSCACLPASPAELARFAGPKTRSHPGAEKSVRLAVSMLIKTVLQVRVYPAQSVVFGCTFSPASSAVHAAFRRLVSPQHMHQPNAQICIAPFP